MGISIELLLGDGLDQDLLCYICKGVPEDPKAVKDCQHIFCAKCIQPFERCPLQNCGCQVGSFIAPPNIFTTLINKIQLQCEFHKNGCQQLLKLSNFHVHKSACEFNPNIPKYCSGGCGLELLPAEASMHNCVLFLKEKLDSKTKEWNEERVNLHAMVNNLQERLADKGLEIEVMKEALLESFKSEGRTESAETETPTTSLAHNWYEQLLARDKTISKMETGVLQDLVANELSKSGCPFPSTTKQCTHMGEIIRSALKRETIRGTDGKEYNTYVAFGDSGIRSAETDSILDRALKSKKRVTFHVNANKLKIFIWTDNA